jgi:hypothetical protein
VTRLGVVSYNVWFEPVHVAARMAALAALADAPPPGTGARPAALALQEVTDGLMRHLRPALVGAGSAHDLREKNGGYWQCRGAGIAVVVRSTTCRLVSAERRDISSYSTVSGWIAASQPPRHYRRSRRARRARLAVTSRPPSGEIFRLTCRPDRRRGRRALHNHAACTM